LDPYVVFLPWGEVRGGTDKNFEKKLKKQKLKQRFHRYEDAE
jgi:hypothetical protein